MSLERRSFVWLLLALIALALYVLHPFFYTLLMAGVLAIIFYPLHLKILKLLKQRANLTALCSVLSVIVLLVIPIGILVGLLTAQIAGLLQSFPQGSPSILTEDISSQTTNGTLNTLMHYWQQYGQPLVEKVEKWSGVDLDISELFWQGLQWIGRWLAQYSPSVISKTANFFFELFFMLLILFYLFRDGQSLFQKLIKISPIEDEYELQLARGLKNTLYGIFYGSFLTGGIQAILATIAFWIAKVPGALVWGVITFFASFVPLIGTAAVLIPVIIYLLIVGEWGYAIFLTIYGVVVIGSADNFLRPLLVKTPTHTALVFLGLFGGMAVFGAIGILLGPMIMGLLSGTLRIYEENYLEESKTASTSS